MRRYVLTGAPGAGKTTILLALKARGHDVVAEAATEVIARAQAHDVDEPWERPGFVEAIVALQRERRLAAPETSIQLHDRCALCTLALCRYLGRQVPDILLQELEDIAAQAIFERRVFFIDNLGFCEPSAARRITFEQSLEFERVHEAVYLDAGYTLTRIAAAPVDIRAVQIEAALAAA